MVPQSAELCWVSKECAELAQLQGDENISRGCHKRRGKGSQWQLKSYPEMAERERVIEGHRWKHLENFPSYHNAK